MTGLEALRAGGAEGAGADDTSVSVVVEVLLAGVGALIVLAFVFGSPMAIVPLLMAAVAVPTTFLLVWPLTAVTDVSVVIQFLVALVGLGIAIDYALLVVMRWREERRDGVSDDLALENTMAHAGRAVVFSGTTVAIALLALVVLVGGQAAQSSDFVDVVYGRFAVLVGLIAALTFVLLARAFRSLVLALTAVLLNLLSVGAAWGAMVLVWQDGLGAEAIWGIEATRAISVEIPVVVFAFLSASRWTIRSSSSAGCGRRTTERGRPARRSSRASAAPAGSSPARR